MARGAGGRSPRGPWAGSERGSRQRAERLSQGPQARLLLSGTRIQGRTAEGGEDGPGGAGLDPGAGTPENDDGSQAAGGGRAQRASFCVQLPCTLPSGRASVLALSTPWILASPLRAEGPGWGPQVTGSETPLAGEQPSPGMRRGCGAEDQTQALGDGEQPCGGRQGRGGRSQAPPPTCAGPPQHCSCGSRTGWCPPRAGGRGGHFLSWWVEGFPCHKGRARARLLNVQVSRDSCMNYE